MREYDDTPEGFGRVAATTAKQVILQRLRDVEDEQVLGQFRGREGDVVSGIVQQGRDPRMVHVDLGTVDADSTAAAELDVTGILAATTPLGVVGLRASAALAHYFGYFARRVLPAVTVCTDAGGIDDAVLQLHQQGASALLVFAMPRYPADTVAAIRLAHRLGMATVVVADTALVPFAKEIDVLLVAPVGTGLIFDSHAAVVVLAISILDAIAKTNPRRTQKRLEAHEALVERWVHEG